LGCTIDSSTGIATEALPNNYDSSKPLKLFTHGFASTTKSSTSTALVNAWMSHYNGKYDVILVDWAPLATPAQYDKWDDYSYDSAARNAIDVGNFIGKCLAGISQKHGMGSTHLVGHSLGAHLVGKIGRSFKKATGELVERITGLDPAGPRFVDGPVMSAIPELNNNLLSKDSAAYVDIIHTNGGLTPAASSLTPHLGALQQLGHRDFYPDGGSAQSGCTFGQDAKLFGACSHSRSILYFLHSIKDQDLFPSHLCDTVEKCNNEEHQTTSWISSWYNSVVYMGEPSQEGWKTGEQQLFYVKIDYCHWTTEVHDNSWCMGK